MEIRGATRGEEGRLGGWKTFDGIEGREREKKKRIAKNRRQRCCLREIIESEVTEVDEVLYFLVTLA